MGTLFYLTLYAADQGAAESAADAAFRRINELEEKLSDYRADSELNLLREKPVGVAVPVSEDLLDVLQRAQEISRRSQGAFDVTVGPYVRLWRFSRKRHQLPAREDLAVARRAVGWRHLVLDKQRRTVTQLVPGMQLDVGGIAKGYSADAALQVLRARGVTRALIAASGDIAIGDPPPGRRGWTVGVSDVGLQKDQVIRSLLLRNAAVSTSGDTEQYLEIEGIRYSHIVDPRTGLGLTNHIQVTVIAPNATLSDALATTVCVIGQQKGFRVLDTYAGTGGLALVKGPDGTRELYSRRFLALSGEK